MPALDTRPWVFDPPPRLARTPRKTQPRPGRPPRFTDQQIIDVRQRYAAGGVTQLALAKELGITRQAAGRIIRGLRWAHVKPPITPHTLPGSAGTTP